jgi:hypothetical protein
MKPSGLVMLRASDDPTDFTKNESHAAKIKPMLESRSFIPALQNLPTQ